MQCSAHMKLTHVVGGGHSGVVEDDVRHKVRIRRRYEGEIVGVDSWYERICQCVELVLIRSQCVASNYGIYWLHKYVIQQSIYTGSRY